MQDKNPQSKQFILIQNEHLGFSGRESQVFFFLSEHSSLKAIHEGVMETWSWHESFLGTSRNSVKVVPETTKDEQQSSVKDYQEKAIFSQSKQWTLLWPLGKTDILICFKIQTLHTIVSSLKN